MRISRILLTLWVLMQNGGVDVDWDTIDQGLLQNWRELLGSSLAISAVPAIANQGEDGDGVAEWRRTERERRGVIAECRSDHCHRRIAVVALDRIAAAAIARRLWERGTDGCLNARRRLREWWFRSLLIYVQEGKGAYSRRDMPLREWPLRDGPFVSWPFRER